MEPREARDIGRTTERQGLRKGGEVFPLELLLLAIELPEGIVFLGAIHDLTQAPADAAMIVQAEKLASLGLLSPRVAHQIDNPLAYVANNLAVLERDCRGLSEVLDAYEQAHPALAAARPELAGRIDQIGEAVDLPYIRANLGQLLSSTRQGVRISGIVEPAGVRPARSGRRRSGGPAAGDRRQPGDDPGPVERRTSRSSSRRVECFRSSTRPAKINQVVLNLLVNAMQAIEATGRRAGRIEIETRARGDEVILEVADDGCGIPEEILPRIFDPFFTTKPVGQGTGLGLAISHGIVADHGGRIEVESTPGRGSRFRMILPVGGKGQGRGQAGRALPAGGDNSPS